MHSGISSISVKTSHEVLELQSGTVFTDSSVDIEGAAEFDSRFESNNVVVEVAPELEGSFIRFESGTTGTEVGGKVEDNTSVKLENSIRGSFHQGNYQFKYGLQCMAIGLVSIAKHTVDSIFSWQTKDLDRVVVLGDELYMALRDTNRISHLCNLLYVPDLPKQSVIDGENFLFQYGDFVCGDVDVVEGEFIESGAYCSLSIALEKIFAQYDSCLLTLCSSTCAIISQNGQYAFIDSHARSGLGMVDGSGRSVVVYFSTLKDLFNHICHLAAGLSDKQKPFEIAGVCVTVTNVKPRKLPIISAVTCKPTDEFGLGHSHIQHVSKSCESANVSCKHSNITSAINDLVLDNGSISQLDVPKIKNAKRTKSLTLTESCKDFDKTFEVEFDLASTKDLPVNIDGRNKCKISVGTYTSKKFKRNDVIEVNSDVEFVSDATNKNIFSPVCKHVCQTLCAHLNVDFVKANVPVFRHVGFLGVPCKNDSIVADGNCFFRAIS